MAKKTSLKDTGTGELEKKLAEKRDELQKLRFEAAGARPKDSNSLAKAKREIARILTELTAREKVSN